MNENVEEPMFTNEFLRLIATIEHHGGTPKVKLVVDKKTFDIIQCQMSGIINNNEFAGITIEIGE